MQVQVQIQINPTVRDFQLLLKLPCQSVLQFEFSVSNGQCMPDSESAFPSKFMALSSSSEIFSLISMVSTVYLHSPYFFPNLIKISLYHSKLSNYSIHILLLLYQNIFFKVILPPCITTLLLYYENVKKYSFLKSISKHRYLFEYSYCLICFSPLQSNLPKFANYSPNKLFLPYVQQVQKPEIGKKSLKCGNFINQNEFSSIFHEDLMFIFLKIFLIIA